MVIVLLGCQDVLTPISPSLTDGDTNTLDSNLQTGSSNFQSSLTEDDREYILSNLDRSGYSLTSDQMDFMITLIDITIPVVQFLGDEMPSSLCDANRDWDEIIKRDPKAEAFALEVKRIIIDKVKIANPGHVLPSCEDLEDLVFHMFMCIKIENIICKSHDESCNTPYHAISIIGCVIDFCI